MAYHLAMKIAKIPPGSTILLRRGRTTKLGMFERIVEELANNKGIKVQYIVPQAGARSAVYKRDYELVDAADYVEAYFPRDRVMEGGTGHVVEAAVNREKPVYAWCVNADGSVDRVGEIDRASVE